MGQMRILEAGISTINRRPQYRASSGFTILEILVVVAVISVIASTILLNTSFKRPKTELKEHAQIVSKTLQLLMQEAILDDRNYALSLAPGLYQVLEYNGEDWLPTEQRFFQTIQQKHAYSDELIIDNTLVSIEKKKEPEPHILILSSGEMSVFQWDISDRDNQLHARLTSDMLGNIQLEGPEERL